MIAAFSRGSEPGPTAVSVGSYPPSSNALSVQIDDAFRKKVDESPVNGG